MERKLKIARNILWIIFAVYTVYITLVLTHKMEPNPALHIALIILLVAVVVYVIAIT